MRTLFITLCILFSFISYSQHKVKAYTGISEHTNLLPKFLETDFDFGISIPMENSMISFFGTYGYGGNAPWMNTHMFDLDFNLLGGGLKIRFRKEKYVYHPMLKLTILTGVGSKYRGKFLDWEGDPYEVLIDYNDVSIFPYFWPANDFGPITQIDYIGHGIDFILIGHFKYDYISTPLVVSYFFGNEFQIFKGFYINVELGYMFRAIRYKEERWMLGDSEPQTKIVDTHKLKTTSNGTTFYEQYLEFGIGINYTFSCRKKK